MEDFPPDDPASAESPYLCKPLVEWRAAALSEASFAGDDHNARSRIPELLDIETIVLPGTPVVTRGRHNRIAPEVHAVKVQERAVAQVPDDVIVK